MDENNLPKGLFGFNKKEVEAYISSMKEDYEKELMEQNKMSGLMFKMDDDPRITKVGKFIRKTSIDEFPQFYHLFSQKE